MKKIIYSCAVMLLAFASACTNDPIEIETKGNLHSLTVNVNTQSLYDEFEITSGIREIMRDQDFAIGIHSFLYDSNGNLVDEKASHQFTFNNTAVNFNGLLEGSYTVLTVETMVDPDNNNESPDWSFKDTEKLSTIQISQDDPEVYYPFVIGVSTQKVNVNANDVSLAVTPKAIGSLVDLYFLNFDKSTHTQVGFATNDIISSYRLDPDLSRNDRYNSDITKSGYINVRCNKDIDSDNIGVTRYLLESSIQYIYCFVKAENEGSGTWTNYTSNKGTAVLEDGKTYSGGFYYVDGNSAPKIYFGDDSGFRDWYLQVSSSDTESSLIPSSVSMNWGSSVTNVQSAMNGYTMTTGASGRAIAQSDGSYMIDYSGKGKETRIMYFFTSATTGLFEADVQFSKTSVSSSEILTYLNANYTYLAEENGTYMYYTSDYKTYVLFFEVNGVWTIGFVDVNYVNNSGAKSYMPSRNIGVSEAVVDISKELKTIQNSIGKTSKNVSCKKNIEFSK